MFLMHKAPLSHSASSRISKTIFPVALSLALPAAVLSASSAQAVSFRFDYVIAFIALGSKP